VDLAVQCGQVANQSRIFALRAEARGRLNTAYMTCSFLGGTLGSWLGGVFYDWTGSYLVSFALSALVLSMSDICIWLAAVPSVANYDKRLWASQQK